MKFLIVPTSTSSFSSLLKLSYLYCFLSAKRADIRAKLILQSFLSFNSINYRYVLLNDIFAQFWSMHACVVWNSSSLQDINLIENVPRRFSRNL